MIECNFSWGGELRPLNPPPALFVAVRLSAAIEPRHSLPQFVTTNDLNINVHLYDNYYLLWRDAYYNLKGF